VARRMKAEGNLGLSMGDILKKGDPGQGMADPGLWDYHVPDDFPLLRSFRSTSTAGGSSLYHLSRIILRVNTSLPICSLQ